MKKYDSMPLWKVVAVFPLVRSLRLVSNPSGERFQTAGMTTRILDRYSPNEDRARMM